MNDYGFYTKEELQHLSESDLSFEIANASLHNTSEFNAYLNLLIEELQKRGD